MIEVRRSPAALHAMFAAAFALFAAGCSHVATVPATKAAAQEQVLAEEDSTDPAESEAEPEPEITKVDEADIGTAGPAQIEDAIETLDAQTESRPALVSELSAAGATPVQGDLLARSRS